MNKVLSKKLAGLAAAGILLGFGCASQAHNVGDPGYYGRLPALQGVIPQIINTVAVVASGAPAHGVAPIYLRVPKAHRMSWRTHCGRYNACNRPVHFVSHDWYRDSYAPAYRNQHGNPPPAQPAHRPAPQKAAPAPRPQHQQAPAPQQRQQAPRQQAPRNNGPQGQGPQGHGPR
jgi:hypothetical protein